MAVTRCRRRWPGGGHGGPKRCRAGGVEGINVEISAENTAACAKTFDGNGCKGGRIDGAWDYFHVHGAVTGGGYGSNEGCQPYRENPCGPLITGLRLNCTNDEMVCSKQCRKGYDKTYNEDRHFSRKPISVYSGDVEVIMREIMTNGPVTAVMKVYSDFLSYKSGEFYLYVLWSGIKYLVAICLVLSVASITGKV